MSLDVLTVTSRRDLRRFVDFPFALYNRREHPAWVPPLRVSVYDALDRQKHPFYAGADRELFLAVRDGTVVGRIAAIENRTSNTFNDDRTGFWGFFECIDDQAAADQLFSAASAWLMSRGLTTMLGPMNPGTNYECGLLVEGFENTPSFMTAWNPPYYDALCAGAKLEKAKDLLGLWFAAAELSYELPPFVSRLRERAMQQGRVTFRSIDVAHYERDVAACWEIYNDAWERNWGFVPMTRAEFDHMANDIKPLLRTEIAFIASVDGEDVGFMLAVPDYNLALANNRNGRLWPTGLLRLLLGKRRLKTGRVIALGVKKKFRTRGVLAVFAFEIMRRAAEIRAIGAEASWLLEDNALIVKPLRDMGARDRMRWRIYERKLALPA